MRDSGAVLFGFAQRREGTVMISGIRLAFVCACRRQRQGVDHCLVDDVELPWR
jgi:hypothetical protein